MSSARQWFAKLVFPGSKSPTDPSSSLSSEKAALHTDDSRSLKLNSLAAVVARSRRKPHSPLLVRERSLPDPPKHRSTLKRPLPKFVPSGEDRLKPKPPADTPGDCPPFTISIMAQPMSRPLSANGSSITQRFSDGSKIPPPSSPSANEFIQKDERLLAHGCTSSTSQSHRPSDLSSIYSIKPPSLPPKSECSPSSDAFSPSKQGVIRSGSDCPGPTLLRCSSSLTLTDKNVSSPQPHSHSKIYSDLTPSSTPNLIQHCKNFLPSPSEMAFCLPPSLPSSRRSSGRISALRIAIDPPCAPPAHSLPAVPSPCELLGDDVHSSPSGSRSSSRMSFASSTSTVQSFEDDYLDTRRDILREKRIKASRQPLAPCKATQRQIPRGRLANMSARSSDLRSPSSNHPPADIPPLPLTPPSPLNTPSDASRRPSSNRPPTSNGQSLKKSISQSTLQRRKRGPWLPTHSSHCDPRATAEKDSKKQRSFHRSTSAVPDSCTPASSSPSPESPRSRHGSESPHAAVRRRLFSGSRQRSTSAGTVTDDLRSLLSLHTELERSQATTSICSVSLQDDGDSDSVPSGSPITPATEYAQRIMSPAEMFALEARVQGEFEDKYGETIRNQQRVITIPQARSSHTKGFSTPPSAFSRQGVRAPSSNLHVQMAPQSNCRPATAQELSYSPFSLLSGPHIAELPLPPSRPHFRPHTAEPRVYRAMARHHPGIGNTPFVPLSPPPRKGSIPTAVKADKRSGVMIRKPSFLDITDDVLSVQHSFLDLGNGEDHAQEDGYDSDAVAYIP